MSSLYLLLQAGAIALILLVIIVILKITRSFRDDATENRAGAALVGIREVLEEKKRRPDRRKMKIPATMKASVGTVKGETKDISVSAAFIQCQTPVPMGEVFLITLKPSRGKHVALKAEVVWSNFNMNKDAVVVRGMGIRFLGLTADERERLKALVEK